MTFHWFDLIWVSACAFLMGGGLGGAYVIRSMRVESWRSAPIGHDESPWERR